MGLDQNWMVRDDIGSELSSMFYHRKFNALESFMQSEWYNDGNQGDFNCELLPVTEDLLDRLQDTIDADELEPTSGFFFGSPERNEYYYDNVRELKDEVIPAVREALKQGKQVLYTSWW